MHRRAYPIKYKSWIRNRAKQSELTRSTTYHIWQFVLLAFYPLSTANTVIVLFLFGRAARDAEDASDQHLHLLQRRNLHSFAQDRVYVSNLLGVSLSLNRVL